MKGHVFRWNKKAIFHQGLSSGGGGSERRNCFLSPLLSKRQRKVTETYLPSTTICSFFKMPNIDCLLREQSKPSFFVSLGSKAWYVQCTFFSLEPIRVVMAVLADRHLYRWAKGSQPGMWIPCCGGFDCGPDGLELPSVTPEVSI